MGGKAELFLLSVEKSQRTGRGLTDLTSLTTLKRKVIRNREPDLLKQKKTNGERGGRRSGVFQMGHKH